MANKLISALVVSLLILVTGCKSTAEKEMRSPGETAFRSSCQTCHILPKPAMKTDDEWPSLVNRYGERAKLSQAKIDDIIVYLIAHN